MYGRKWLKPRQWTTQNGRHGTTVCTNLICWSGLPWQIRLHFPSSGCDSRYFDQCGACHQSVQPCCQSGPGCWSLPPPTEPLTEDHHLRGGRWRTWAVQQAATKAKHSSTTAKCQASVSEELWNNWQRWTSTFIQQQQHTQSQATKIRLVNVFLHNSSANLIYLWSCIAYRFLTFSISQKEPRPPLDQESITSLACCSSTLDLGTKKSGKTSRNAVTSMFCNSMQVPACNSTWTE